MDKAHNFNLKNGVKKKTQNTRKQKDKGEGKKRIKIQGLSMVGLI